MSPSRLGTQPVGEVAEVAEGVHQLKVPIPIPLVYVSAYLVEGDDGWTLIDTGFDYGEGKAAWEAGARSLGFGLESDVSRIIVTHFHPDHLGAARWLQETSGAPVYMLESEIRNARAVWENRDTSRFVEHLVRHGMDRETTERATASMRTSLALPEKMVALEEGEELPLGPGMARVVRAPGHADHQVVLHDEGRRILFAADHVLLKITPNVGLWPETAPNPLLRYEESLRSMRDLPVELVLPGHGPIFHDLRGRVDELLAHHEERLGEMLREVEDGPRTPFEVSRKVFRYGLSIYERCFALAETLAHLDHLVLQGRAERVESEDLVRFRAS
ncbi:MBL fold metallo-hydrolase [Rubrobacter marinus]|uniref:MBL fold metallo-hydrolase n=1 Tax=Rubrobacter marinus TaxID=2653852 RepID=UPI00140966E7|nr:MBL fold metallo-hydrolase [Rubrobacter marinus]